MKDPLSGGGDGWKPNLFVPGFEKCGTTALCDYLRQHPDIYIIEPKEPATLAIGIEFPSWRKRHNTAVRPYSAHMSPKAYRRRFEEHVGFRYRGDGTQGYIWPPRFPGRLKEFSPDSKLLFMIREQKRRLVSLYFYGFNTHLEPDFQKWIEERFRPQAKFFLFTNVLNEYYKLFGDSMRVIDNAALLRSPQKVMSEVFGFLGVKEVDVSPLSSNVSEMKTMDEYQRRRALPLLRVRSRVMTPVEYFLNMADGGVAVRGRIPLGRINPFRSFGRRSSSTSHPNTRGGTDATGGREVVPPDLASALDEDYASAQEFCRSRHLLLGASQGASDGR